MSHSGGEFSRFYINFIIVKITTPIYNYVSRCIEKHWWFLVLWTKGPIDLWHHFVSAVHRKLPYIRKCWGSILVCWAEGPTDLWYHFVYAICNPPSTVRRYLPYLRNCLESFFLLIWCRHILGHCHYAREIYIWLNHSKGTLGSLNTQKQVHFLFPYLFRTCDLTFSLFCIDYFNGLRGSTQQVCIWLNLENPEGISVPPKCHFILCPFKKI